ncbi:UdgX family uracil-DNA binding protein [Acetobacteraceae bacterium ESL0709]|nr:UdgX family uracil-DNA binding protein [Acetobacteraceae bacterium ESL0697]MDF7678359.1 UdgX family uracil-DNA binding protein [Acetobacteraceae bacterium ESL0709]
MKTVTLETDSDFQGWRYQIIPILEAYTPFNEIRFVTSPSDSLYKEGYSRSKTDFSSALMIPRKFISLVIAVFSSGRPDRFCLLYAFLEKIRDKADLEPETDPLLIRMKAISHEAKKAALLLRESLPPASMTGQVVLHLAIPTALLDSQADALLALRPDNWLIRTEHRILCAHQGKLFFAPAPPQTATLETEALFDFACKNGISPEKSSFWHSVVPFHVTPAVEFVQKIPSLTVLKAYATDCQLCPLCKAASRTVTGEGSHEAKLMFVGEQPGDQEDLQGRPFVGPAGQLFDRALQECGIEREKSWVTNAVKHFRFTPYGNGKRLHQKPEAEHIRACSPWLQRERELLKPKVTIMMGVTGGTAVLGRPITVSRERSKILTLQDGSIGLVTVHPSFLLRQPDEDSRAREYDHFVADLRLAYSALS